MRRTIDQENAIFEIVGMYLSNMRNAQTVETLDKNDSILTNIVCALRRLDMLSLEEKLDIDKTSGKIYISTNKAIKAQTA